MQIAASEVAGNHREIVPVRRDRARFELPVCSARTINSCKEII